MDRTINIPNADNAFLEMLAEKMGWTISPATSHAEDRRKPSLDTPEKRKRAIEKLQAIAGTLPDSHVDDWKQAKEAYIKTRHL